MGCAAIMLRNPSCVAVSGRRVITVPSVSLCLCASVFCALTVNRRDTETQRHRGTEFLWFGLIVFML